MLHTELVGMFITTTTIPCCNGSSVIIAKCRTTYRFCMATLLF